MKKLTRYLLFLPIVFIIVLLFSVFAVKAMAITYASPNSIPAPSLIAILITKTPTLTPAPNPICKTNADCPSPCDPAKTTKTCIGAGTQFAYCIYNSLMLGGGACKISGLNDTSCPLVCPAGSISSITIPVPTSTPTPTPAPRLVWNRIAACAISSNGISSAPTDAPGYSVCIMNVYTDSSCTVPGGGYVIDCKLNNPGETMTTCQPYGGGLFERKDSCTSCTPPPPTPTPTPTPTITSTGPPTFPTSIPVSTAPIAGVCIYKFAVDALKQDYLNQTGSPVPTLLEVNVLASAYNLAQNSCKE